METTADFEQVRQSEEQLLGVYRKSIIPFSRTFSVAALIAFILLVITLLLPSLLPLGPAIGLGFIVLGLGALRVWYLWGRTIIMLTNLRVIALEQRAIFHRELQEAFLGDVCNVAARVKGVSPSLFHYGDLLIQTEAEWWIKDVHNPYELKEAVFEAMHDRKHREVSTLPKKFWRRGSAPRRRVVVRRVERDR